MQRVQVKTSSPLCTITWQAAAEAQAGAPRACATNCRSASTWLTCWLGGAKTLASVLRARAFVSESRGTDVARVQGRHGGARDGCSGALPQQTEGFDGGAGGAGVHV